MRRTKPIRKLDVIGQLCLPADKVIGQVFESHINENYLIKAPDCKGNDSIELLAIHNDKEHKEMLKLQKQMLETAKRQSVINDNNIRNVTEMMKQLRERFIESNGFFQSCDEKRIQALKLVSEEKQLHVYLKKEQVKLSSDIATLQKFRNDISATVHSYDLYEQVLVDAASQHNNWSSSSDLLAQDSILKMNECKMSEIEEVRLKMIKMTNDASNAILGLTTTLNDLQRDMNKASIECLYWEKILVNIKNRIVENDLEKIRIISGVDKIYRMLVRAQGTDATLNEDFDKRFKFIREEFHVLTEVLKECTHDHSEEQVKGK